MKWHFSLIIRPQRPVIDTSNTSLLVPRQLGKRKQTRSDSNESDLMASPALM